MTAQAFVFPGQGSQSVGMLESFRVASSVVEDTVAEANEALGFDLGTMIADGPVEQLNLTEYTQPAMLLAGVAVYRAWLAAGGERPAWMAGHSLGEYTAFVCAGALDFAPTLRLVRLRGQLMQAAVPEGEGGMAAVLGLDDDALREVCREAAGDEVVEAVNLNAPGQVVIAGHRSAIERALAVARERGARRGVFLPVSAPCHSSLMAPAADRLAEALAEIAISLPRVPVVNNVDVAVAETPAEIREALVRQLHSPVRWVECVEWLAAQGIDRLVECGPGKVLTGLTRRIDRRLDAMSLHDADALAAALERETA